MSDRPNSYNTNTSSSLNYEQRSLFNEQTSPTSRLNDSSANYVMGSSSLVRWKTAIAKHQSSITAMIPAIQTSLFEMQAHHCDPHEIAPFQLPLQPAEFYRLPSVDSGDTCIYFVIDLISSFEEPVLLYIGETYQSHKRWKGSHDCKRYLLNYQDLHFTHNLPTQVVMTFWWDAPKSQRHRQQLEKILIEKWRSPFNKENWNFWGTPFVN